ncbi:uncharacterized protein N7446_006289 [Penicillium canescens]|uniref:Uncharacterized protein n=1 Tax=Penicillium canescens TaxID=5083 RepID=A0AAD6IJE3_PENCN|nr:uncharacterized protein N7446_006289 [Penicillium canescens]KAJ6051654.1 hypothetical protein N7460_002188 [Penicillium canescens]KAJ6062169.1 hypothetical protein N7446_006289 [Penicillium canescens]KAJ6065416.1 hypothetical protein N7444_001069 [Penicillium canescens]
MVDEEKSTQDSVQREAAQRGLQKTDSNSFTWNTDHKDFPRNWTLWRKTYDGLLIFFLEFFTTVISTTGPSATEPAMKEYRLSRVIALTCFQFMYGIGQALGGLVMPPFSETLGRRKSYLFSAALYSISSLLVGIVPSPEQAVVPLAMELQYHVCAGWRWIFHTSAITSAVLFVLLFAVKESRPTKLLSERLDSLQSEVGSLDLDLTNPDRPTRPYEFLTVILLRPARLGMTEPIIILVASISATVWGMVYLFTESFTVVYSQFGWAETSTSLPFIALLPGVLLGGFVRLWDQHQMNNRQRNGVSPKPEDKINGFAIAAPALAVGLWVFGWTVPPLVHTHWIVSMFGLALIGFAVNEFAYTLSGYIADSYTIYASSGLAAVAFLRGTLSGSSRDIVLRDTVYIPQAWPAA